MPGLDRVIHLATDRGVAVIGAAHHRQHLAGVRIHHQHRPVVDAIACGKAGDTVVYCLLRQGLCLRVERRHDLQAGGQEITRVVTLLQLAPDVVDEMRREWRALCRHGLVPGSQRRSEILHEGLARDGLGDVAVAHHGIQHVLLATARTREPFGQEGVVIARCLRQAGEEARLRQVEFSRRRPKVRLRRGLDAERLVAVEDRIQVHLENLVLRVLLLQLHREDQFSRLPVQAPAAGAVGQ